MPRTESTSPLSAAEALELWEKAWSLPPLQRAVVLAACAAGLPVRTVAAWPVGRRDSVLWGLREQLFGTALEAVSACPQCGTDVELALDQGALLAVTPETALEVTVSANGRQHRFRTPGTDDVAAALACPAEPAHGVLIRRCLLDGNAAAFADDPRPVLDAWEQADPMADITLRLRCPECAHDWDDLVDVTAFLWSELDAWCRRTMVEVHELARAYGWAESQTLGLSPWRRQCYLGLATA